MSKFVGALLEGALGLAILGGVATISFIAGKEVGKVELEYERMTREIESEEKDIPAPKPKKKKGIMHFLRAVKDGELHIEVKPKGE